MGTKKSSARSCRLSSATERPFDRALPFRALPGGTSSSAAESPPLQTLLNPLKPCHFQNILVLVDKIFRCNGEEPIEVAGGRLKP